MSVTAVDGFAGKAAERASSAPSDSGLLVGFPSVGRLPPSSVTMAAIASTTTTIQAPIVRHGWLALAEARARVDSRVLRGALATIPLIRPTPPPGLPGRGAQRLVLDGGAGARVHAVRRLPSCPRARDGDRGYPRPT